MTQEIELIVRGQTLRGTLRRPEAMNGTAVVLLHGFGGRANSRMKEALAEQFLNMGCAVVQVHFSGHGTSDGAFRDMTIPIQVQEARAMLDLAWNTDGVSRVLIAAHSQGGTVAALLAGDEPARVNGLMLLSAAGHISDGCRRGVLQDAHFDPQIIPDTVAMFGYELSGAYFRAAQTLDEYGHAARYPGPVCIIHETEDAIVPVWCADKYHEAFPDSEKHLLPGHDHRLLDQLPEVTAILREFIERHHLI